MIVPGSANPLLASTDAGGYTIAKSLRLRNSASAYLTRTPSSTTNQKTWTWSAWVKRGTLGAVMPLFNANGSSPVGTQFGCVFASSDKIQFYTDNSSSSNFVTTQVFRDTSAWYHIVIAFDTTQATNTNRVKLYVNGSQITAFDTASYPSQNLNTAINSNTLHNIGKPYDAYYFDGYLTEINFVDGQQLTPSSFGETDSVTGVWKPKAYSGTYGTNGFYLKFTDVATTSGSNAGLGKDFSGNGNYWTTNNISVTSGETYDSMKDVPTLTDTDTANYCVWNPINKATDTVMSDGNLTVTASSNFDYSALGSTGITTGKWYWEIKLLVSDAVTAGGISQALTPSQLTGWIGTLSTVYMYNWDGKKVNSGSTTYGATYAVGDIIGTAFDATNGTIEFFKNGTSQGVAFTSIPSATYFPVTVVFGGRKIAANFGQRPFAYTPPTGYKALNTYNLPDSTIVAGNKVMDATTYTGNGSTQSITNAGGFKPDFVWVKNRTTGPSAHRLVDSVRGATKEMYSNATDAEATDTNGITAFNSNGFSVGSTGGVNLNGNAIVGWQWQAGQGTTSSNTSGSITSTVSVNATAGFSIVSYTGTGATATVGHGLGVAPKMMIIKSRGIEDWFVYHASLGGSPPGYMKLNTTGANGGGSSAIFPSAPSSTVINIGSGSGVGANGVQHIAYCWAEIAGFSKFGSYTGNDSTDGTFVYTGFRPKYVMIKNATTSGYSWVVLDSARNTYNVENSILLPNDSGAEDSSGNRMDFLSNGFKLRGTGLWGNSSGNTYIYAAFAENPQKLALAR